MELTQASCWQSFSVPLPGFKVLVRLSGRQCILAGLFQCLLLRLFLLLLQLLAILSFICCAHRLSSFLTPKSVIDGDAEAK